MVDAAREARTFIEGHTRSDLNHNRMLVLALVRLVEVVGEAASRVPSDTRMRIPSIPWPHVVAMRNRLIHGYYDVDLDRVWDTVVNDLPPLIAAVEEYLATDGDEPR